MGYQSILSSKAKGLSASQRFNRRDYHLYHPAERSRESQPNPRSALWPVVRLAQPCREPWRSLRRLAHRRDRVPARRRRSPRRRAAASCYFFCFPYSCLAACGAPYKRRDLPRPPAHRSLVPARRAGGSPRGIAFGNHSWYPITVYRLVSCPPFSFFRCSTTSAPHFTRLARAFRTARSDRHVAFVSVSCDGQAVRGSELLFTQKNNAAYTRRSTAESGANSSLNQCEYGTRA